MNSIIILIIFLIVFCCFKDKIMDMIPSSKFMKMSTFGSNKQINNNKQ
jgi:hypothetical protein